MPATTNHRDSAYSQLRRDTHPHCAVCSPDNPHGLGLEFHRAGDGAGGIVEASFTCNDAHQGYSGVLHGGVVSMLLDGVMTNCLFFQDIVAMTVELTVRFRRPVAIMKRATVRAWIVASTSPVYDMAAELIQDDEVKATAKGKFLSKSFCGLFNKTKQ